jgi:hypothetical protein
MTRRRVIALCVAGVLAAVALVLFLPSSEKPYHDYVAERRAAGLPTTFAELAGPEPPGAAAAAAALGVAWQELVANEGPTSDWRGSGFDGQSVTLDDEPFPALSKADLAALTETAVRLRPYLDPLVRAADAPRLWFPPVIGPDGWRSDADVKLLQNAQRALLIAATGDPDPARRLAACRASLTLAGSADPSDWLRTMVAIAGRTSGISAVRYGVETGALDPAAARAALDPLLAVSPEAEYRRALRGETVGLIELYGALISGRAQSRVPRGTIGQQIARVLERAASRMKGRTAFDEWEPGLARELVAVCRAIDAAAAVPELSTLLTAEDVAATDPTGTARLLGATMMMTITADRVIRIPAAASLARVGLAVAERRAKTGAFPASLDELKDAVDGGVPLDPYTRAPFRYETTADGVRIASAEPVLGDPAIAERELRMRGLVWELKR